MRPMAEAIELFTGKRCVIQVEVEIYNTWWSNGGFAVNESLGWRQQLRENLVVLRLVREILYEE